MTLCLSMDIFVNVTMYEPWSIIFLMDLALYTFLLLLLLLLFHSRNLSHTVYTKIEIN